MKKLFTILFIALACALEAPGQIQKKLAEGLPYTVVQGDTIYFDSLPAARVTGKAKRHKGTDWRKYYRLVYNFNKVYPYALVGREMMAQVDSTIEHGGLDRRERNRYVKRVEKELLDLFAKDIWNMTFSQGFVLLRLVDRECGLSGYEIIQTYEGDFAAKFWQAVAKLFTADIKTKYEPEGRDAQLEELARIWDAGGWDTFYYSVFYESPKKTVLPATRLTDFK